MAGMSFINNMRPPIGRLPSGRIAEVLDQGVVTSNKVPHPRVVLTGPVAILWDIENCPVPGEVNAEDVAGNVRMALRVHPAVKGAVTMFSAYGDFNHFPRRLREGCQRTGVNLIDVPNGKKDASDKAILVDMFLFALDNPPPCTILLISGDVDFAPALHKLGQRGYTMVLAIPAGVGVSSVLCNAGRFVWDWPSVARGEGLIPAKTSLNRYGDERMTEMSAYMMGTAWQSNDDSDFLAEDERFVYSQQLNNNSFHSGHVEASQFAVATSLSHGGPLPFDFTKLNVSQVPLQTSGLSSQAFPCGPNFQGNQVCSLPVAASSCGRVVPASATSASSHSAQTPADFSSNAESERWVQPGDLQGLKGQLTRLVKLNGGKVQLLRLPSEYCKLFGRPLYLSEYGSPKLVHLIDRMPDVFLIKGEGNKRTLHLKESFRTQQQKHRRARSNINLVMNQPDKLSDPAEQGLVDGDDFVEDIILLQRQPEIGSDDEKASGGNEESDEANKGYECLNEEGKVVDGEASDGEAYMADVMLEVFKQEVQELLVSHACAIPLSGFEMLYKQRYSRELDVAALGVEELELLFAKLEDVATVKEDKARRKFLVARFVA